MKVTRRRLRKLICRLRGHDSWGHVPWGGLPFSGMFGIDSSCRCCGANTSIAIPSSFTIFNERFRETTEDML